MCPHALYILNTVTLVGHKLCVKAVTKSVVIQNHLSPFSFLSLHVCPPPPDEFPSQTSQTCSETASVPQMMYLARSRHLICDHVNGCLSAL